MLLSVPDEPARVLGRGSRVQIDLGALGRGAGTGTSASFGPGDGLGGEGKGGGGRGEGIGIGEIDNPALEGRVTTRFLIARDGSVSVSADGGSDLPDAKVVSCVVGAFAQLSFPEPAGGTVTVDYPIAFSPE